MQAHGADSKAKESCLFPWQTIFRDQEITNSVHSHFRDTKVSWTMSFQSAPLRVQREHFFEGSYDTHPLKCLVALLCSRRLPVTSSYTLGTVGSESISHRWQTGSLCLLSCNVSSWISWKYQKSWSVHHRRDAGTALMYDKTQKHTPFRGNPVYLHFWSPVFICVWERSWKGRSLGPGRQASMADQHQHNMGQWLTL